jgi:hypothetical protein
MNDHDRANLEFLLKATPEVLEEWSREVTQDDLDYAQELFDAYQLELNEREKALDMDIDDDFDQAISEAENRGGVLYKFETSSVH